MNEEKLVHDLTLMLIYLTSWKEGSGKYSCRSSWKGYDFDILNELMDEHLIFYKYRWKSVVLTDDGEEEAKRLIAELKKNSSEE